VHADALVSAAPASEVMPVGHLVQDVALAAEYEPAAQGVHVVAPAAKYVPAAQLANVVSAVEVHAAITRWFALAVEQIVQPAADCAE